MDPDGVDVFPMKNVEIPASYVGLSDSRESEKHISRKQVHIPAAETENPRLKKWLVGRYVRICQHNNLIQNPQVHHTTRFIFLPNIVPTIWIYMYNIYIYIYGCFQQ